MSEPNRDFYLIIENKEKPFFREMDFKETTYQQVVKDIVEGQYEDIYRVYRFNPVDNKQCGNVTSMVARSCMDYFLDKGVNGESVLPRFILDNVPDCEERLEEDLIEAMSERRHQRGLYAYYHSADR